jgi:hypothetical protein
MVEDELLELGRAIEAKAKTGQSTLFKADNLPAAGRLVAARSRLAHCADAAPAPCVGDPRLLGRSCDERMPCERRSSRSREMLTRR